MEVKILPINCVVWARQAFEWSVKYSQFESGLSASPVLISYKGLIFISEKAWAPCFSHVEGRGQGTKSFGVVVML